MSLYGNTSCTKRARRGLGARGTQTEEAEPAATPPPPAIADPGVVKQDKSSRGSVDTTKTRSDPQRVRMSSGERPFDAAKGKQPITEALCQTPPAPPPPAQKHSQQPPAVVQNWSALQCSKKNTELCGDDHAPVTRGRMRAQYPLPHGQKHGGVR